MNWTFHEITEYLRTRSIAVALWVSLGLLAIAIVNVSLSAWNNRTIKKNDYAPQNVQPMRNTSGERGPSVERVVEAFLFGNPRPIVAVAAPNTTLNLKLQGVLSATTPSMARAIIQVGTKPGALYSVGDQIKGESASVQEIRPTEVLLNRAGAIERLPLASAANSRGASIVFGSTDGGSDAIAEEVASFDSANFEVKTLNTKRAEVQPKPDSINGERRKIKRPSFSGVDRAIKKNNDI